MRVPIRLLLLLLLAVPLHAAAGQDAAAEQHAAPALRPVHLLGTPVAHAARTLPAVLPRAAVERPPSDPLDALLGAAPWPASAVAEAPSFDADALARAVHDAVNAVREQHGYAPLAWSEPLAEVAHAHSADMARRRYFAHVDPQGRDAHARARAAGLSPGAGYAGVGENLFLTHRYHAYRVASTAEGRRYVFDWKTAEELARETVAAWMESRAHRHNLLTSAYHRHAVGVVLADNQAVFVTHNLDSGR